MDLFGDEWSDMAHYCDASPETFSAVAVEGSLIWINPRPALVLLGRLQDTATAPGIAALDSWLERTGFELSVPP